MNMSPLFPKKDIIALIRSEKPVVNKNHVHSQRMVTQAVCFTEILLLPSRLLLFAFLVEEDCYLVCK